MAGRFGTSKLDGPGDVINKAEGKVGEIQALAKKWYKVVYDGEEISGLEPLSAEDEGAVRDALPPQCHKLLPPDITAFVNEERMAQDWGEVSVRLIAASLKDINVLATALVEDADRRKGGEQVQQPMLLRLLLRELELWGLFLAKGIDPKDRRWARNVALKYKTLAALGNSRWPEIEAVFDLDGDGTTAGPAPLPQADDKLSTSFALDPAAGNDEPPLSTRPRANATTTTRPGSPQDQQRPITSTELHTLQTFFANAPNAPPIRKEAMEFGVGLGVAQAVEDKGIRTASKLSEDDVEGLALNQKGDTRVMSYKIQAMKSNTAHRDEEEQARKREKAREREVAAQLRNSELIEEERGRLKQSLQDTEDLLAKVDVNGTLDGGEEKLRSRLEAVKARLAASNGWEGKLSSSESLLATAEAQTGILGEIDTSTTYSYSTDEQLVASCSGGAALYGVNFFPNVEELSRVPLAPVLKTPVHVDLRGPNIPFEARVYKATSQEMVSSFHNSTKTSGMTVAESTVSSVGGSASVSGWGAKVSASHSETNSTDSEKSTSTESNKTSSSQSKTSTATIVEYIVCPMKSFRIPLNEMRVTDEVIEVANRVGSLREARSFLDTFGSHVSFGTHLMGGGLLSYRHYTDAGGVKVKTMALMRPATEASKESKSKATESSVSASGSYMGVTGSASASMSNATSSGSADFSESAENEEGKEEKTQAVYTSYVRSLGPNAATATTFASSLFADNSSWAIIDRGPLSALITIDDLLRKDLHEHNVDEQSINWIQVARESRARDWTYLLDQPSTVPLALRAVISHNAPRRAKNNDLQASLLQLVTLGANVPIEEVDSLVELSNIAQSAAKVFVDAAKATKVQQQAAPDEGETGLDFIGRIRDGLASEDGEVSGAVTLVPEEENPAIYALLRGLKWTPQSWARFEANMTLQGQELVMEQLQLQAGLRITAMDNAALKAVFDALQMAKWDPPLPGWTELRDTRDAQNLSALKLRGVTLTRNKRVEGIRLTSGASAAGGFYPLRLPVIKTGHFSTLTTLALSDLGLGGTLEESGIFSELKALIVLNLSRNRLTGDVLSPRNLPRLKVLDLSENMLDGEIHTDVWTHKALEDVNFSYNNLGGNVMQGIDMPSVRSINLSHNLRGWTWEKEKLPSLDELKALDGRPYGELGGYPKTQKTDIADGYESEFEYSKFADSSWALKDDPFKRCKKLQCIDLICCGWYDLHVMRHWSTIDRVKTANDGGVAVERRYNFHGADLFDRSNSVVLTDPQVIAGLLLGKGPKPGPLLAKRLPGVKILYRRATFFDFQTLPMDLSAAPEWLTGLEPALG